MAGEGGGKKETREGLIFNKAPLPGRLAGDSQREWPSIKLAFKVKEGAFEVALVKDLFFFNGAKEERGAANIVDEARDAFGVMVQAGHEVVGEELVLVAGDAEVMFNISGGFGKVKGRQGVAEGNALIEGLVGSEAQFSVQIGLTDEDESEEGA
jgi:uncharacterized protein YciU (UPF0263 family)